MTVTCAPFAAGLSRESTALCMYLSSCLLIPPLRCIFWWKILTFSDSPFSRTNTVCGSSCRCATTLPHLLRYLISVSGGNKTGPGCQSANSLCKASRLLGVCPAVTAGFKQILKASQLAEPNVAPYAALLDAEPGLPRTFRPPLLANVLPRTSRSCKDDVRQLDKERESCLLISSFRFCQSNVLSFSAGFLQS